MQGQFEKKIYSTSGLIEGISISKGGRVGVTKSIITTLGLQDSARAYLYWNPTSETVAIDFTKNEDDGSFPIRFITPDSAYISASQFFRAADLDPAEYAGIYAYSTVNGADINLSKASTNVILVDLKGAGQRSAQPVAA